MINIVQLFLKRHTYLLLFFLFWAGVIAVIYFLWFPLPQPKADNPYPAFGLMLWITLTGITSGATILRRFGITYRFRGEQLVFSVGLGFAMIAYLVFALGLVHLLYSGVMYGLLVLLTCISYKEIQTTVATFLHYLKRSYRPAMIDVVLGAIIMFLLLYHFLGTLVPPVFFDALVYHLGMPKLYILNHAIVYCPYNFYSNFPFTLEMLYTFGLLLQGGILVKCLNYMIHLLMLAGLYSFARTYLTHRTALISVAIFYTIPWIGITSFLLYIDIGLSCYFWLAMYAFINWVIRKETGWLVLSGIFTGVMLGIKYLAVYGACILGISLVIFLIWKHYFEKESCAQETGMLPSLWHRYRPIFHFAIPAFLVGSPWYIKNLIWTGNPVYPFLFGGGEWDLARVQSYMDEYYYHTGSVHGSLWSFFKLPWDLVFQYETLIGPVFLVFLPVLLFVKRVPPIIKYLLGASLLFVICWVSGSQQTRFLLPVFPFLSVAAGYAISEGLASHGNTGWLKKIGYLILFSFILSNVFKELNVESLFEPFAVIMGIESKSEYLSRQLPSLYPITQYANEILPPEAKILYIGETRGYYSDRVFIANSAHDKTPIVELAHQSRDVNDLLEKLKMLAVTHIILNKREGTRLDKQYNYLHWKTAEDKAKFWEFYHNRLKLLKSINDSELLEIVQTP
jgi:hypothetical protein